MSKLTCTNKGEICQPFRVGEGVWFYVSRGKFEFYLQEGHVVKNMTVPTSQIRRALNALDRVVGAKITKPTRKAA